MSAIEKTLSRVNERIVKQEFYEAHQAVRTVVARYVRAKNYGLAIGLLYSSALLLSKAGQTGSSSDLLLYMLKVYDLAGVKPEGTSKGRVAEVCWQLDPKDSVLKQVGQRVLAWAPFDADLSDMFGLIFARANDPNEAEKYLLMGTKDSATKLAKLHKLWSDNEADADSKALILSRGVLGYLSTQNIRNALIYWQAVEPKNDLSLHSNLITDFLELLIKTCQTKDANLYKLLASNYKPTQMVPAWQSAIQRIERDFFAIVPQQQFNMMDLMGGIMK